MSGEASGSFSLSAQLVTQIAPPSDACESACPPRRSGTKGVECIYSGSFIWKRRIFTEVGFGGVPKERDGNLGAKAPVRIKILYFMVQGRLGKNISLYLREYRPT